MTGPVTSAVTGPATSAVTGPATGVGAELVIDLGDAAAPWTPPEPPRPVLRRRAVAARFVAVLLAAAALLVAAGPGVPEPLFRLPGELMGLELAGGRLYLTRAGGFEARTTGGRLLWTRPRDTAAQRLVTVRAGVALLSTQYAGSLTPGTAAVAAVDADTGAELWRRAGAKVDGHTGDRVVLEDLAEPHRLVGVDPRTGAPAWTAELADGTVLLMGGFEPASVDLLTADGTLIRRDPASGAVTTRQPLQQWPGRRVLGFEVSGEQITVSRADRPGADVYDLATGRFVRHTADVGPARFACGPGRLCSVGGDGVHAYDAATGRMLWMIMEYNEIFGMDGDRMLLGGYGTSVAANHEPVVFTVDLRTGARLGRLDGWVPAYAGAGAPFVVFRPGPDRRDGLLGLYDRRSGGVRVFGRAAFPGRPSCDIGFGVIACVGDGLTVWRRP
ncbi:PQQ-binding-like beta-propeller repeat protein [Dactylosporangium sp. NPDC051541]|uniref:outer membrane protein assembly factor BamB family protein n=1 Tax=Dactylosporangium sp. NPDC051541 TaxID=3363977 RepID=UPI0037A6A67F